jgi:orotidine 5'-phosphate decarboxylase subfamily 1
MTAMTIGREVPGKVEDRLIVALDVPAISEARALIDKLEGVVSFFKVGLWLQFAAGFDGLLDYLLAKNKNIFLDAKMFDIGETVRQGVARAAERGVTFVTVHGDGEIMKAAVAGKGNSRLKIFAITVLTSVDQDGLRELGYLCSVEDLIRLRVKRAIECGCDGIIASPHDNPTGFANSRESSGCWSPRRGFGSPARPPMTTSGRAPRRKRSRLVLIISSSAARSSEATIPPAPRQRSSRTCETRHSRASHWPRVTGPCRVAGPGATMLPLLP